MKGDLKPETTLTVGLWFLKFDSEQAADIPDVAFSKLPYSRATPGSCFIAFLNHNKPAASSRNSWLSINSVGAVLSVPCTADAARKPNESTVDCVRRVLDPP